MNAVSSNTSSRPFSLPAVLTILLGLLGAGSGLVVRSVSVLGGLLLVSSVVVNVVSVTVVDSGTSSQ